jgi:ribosomal protein L29
MKRKDRTAILESTLDELVKQVADLRGKILKLKIERFSKQTKNQRELKNMRLQLALLLTAIKQKELNHG